MLTLYNLFSTIAVALYAPFIFLKKGPADKRAFVSERFGMSSYARTDIWVHAVSVGEVLACLPFLKRLKKEFPSRKIVVSTTTYTGQNIARDKFPEADRIMYIPMDSPLCVAKAAASLRPEVFITLETELWPSLFRALKQGGSRIVILNGRISGSSYRGYRKIRRFMKKVLAYVDFLYMQDEKYAARIIDLGADRRRVGVMGNFKFDIAFDTSGPPPWLRDLCGKILLAASTHRGEDETVLDAFMSVSERFADVKLIIAPRHPERFDEVAELIGRKGLAFTRRSGFGGMESSRAGAGSKEFRVVLLDTMGELPSVFSKADVSFIGGSLVPVGGHNILEPAYWSRPIIFGPHMDNFPVAREFLERSAAVQVGSSRELADAVIHILTDVGKASAMGRSARNIFDKNTGAVDKATELIRGIIGAA